MMSTPVIIPHYSLCSPLRKLASTQPMVSCMQQYLHYSDNCVPSSVQEFALVNTHSFAYKATLIEHILILVGQVWIMEDRSQYVDNWGPIVLSCCRGLAQCSNTFSRCRHVFSKQYCCYSKFTQPEVLFCSPLDYQT